LEIGLKWCVEEVWGCEDLLQVKRLVLGESMKKGASHAKVKVLFKDCIFHAVDFYWFTLHFSQSF
jgi:hypothetical protein